MIIRGDVVWNMILKLFTGIQGKVIFTMAVFSWCLVMFWLFYPYKPITIHSIDIVNPGGVYPGGILVYETNYTKEKSYPVVSVVRQLVNDTVIVLAEGPKSRLPVGNHKVKVSVKLPEYASTGTHNIHLIIEYRVNPLRVISVIVKSKSFQIKKKAIE